MDSRWSLREEVHLNQRKKINKYIITVLGMWHMNSYWSIYIIIVWQNKKNHFNGCVLHLVHKLMDRSKQPITPIYIFTCYHHYWVLPSLGFVVHLWMNEQWMVDLMSWRVEQLLIRTKNPHQSNIIVRQFWFCQLGRWCNVICSNKGLTRKMSALKLFTVADTAPFP